MAGASLVLAACMTTPAPPRAAVVPRISPRSGGSPSPPVATAPTTTDPGGLPQTTDRPTGDDPVFQAHLQALWRAVVDGDPSEGMQSFFPLSAYVQVKSIWDPVHDYQSRLVPDFDADVLTEHDSLGPDIATAELTSVSVPPTAVWVRPGTEYNKGGYWRVYGATVEYTVGGRPRSFTIASLISWRGEWYVVHLARIR